MKEKLKFIAIVFLIFSGTIACVSDSKNDMETIKSKWNLLQVIYEDGSINHLEQGDFVLIEDDVILEVINRLGKRRYPYVRKNSVLYVTSGDVVVEWEIMSLDTNNLQLRTPIGIYVLKR